MKLPQKKKTTNNDTESPSTEGEMLSRDMKMLAFLKAVERYKKEQKNQTLEGKSFTTIETEEIRKD